MNLNSEAIKLPICERNTNECCMGHLKTKINVQGFIFLFFLCKSALVSGLGNTSGADGIGNVRAAWSIVEDTGLETIQVNCCSEGSWGKPHRISSPQDNSIQPLMAVSINGHAALIWFATNQKTFKKSIQGAYFTPLTGWSKPQSLNTEKEPTPTYTLSISHGKDGKAIAVWYSLINGVYVARSSTTSDGFWSPPITISNATCECK